MARNIANPNNPEFSRHLYLAAIKKDVHYFQQLRAHDVQWRDFSVGYLSGKNPLHFLASNTLSYNYFQNLVDASSGAINAQDSNGRTPIFAAISFSNNRQRVIDLIQQGARLDIKDNFGSTPLMHALYLMQMRNTEEDFATLVAIVNVLVQSIGISSDPKDLQYISNLIEWIRDPQRQYIKNIFQNITLPKHQDERQGNDDYFTGVVDRKFQELDRNFNAASFQGRDVYKIVDDFNKELIAGLGESKFVLAKLFSKIRECADNPTQNQPPKDYSFYVRAAARIIVIESLLPFDGVMSKYIGEDSRYDGCKQSIRDEIRNQQAMLDQYVLNMAHMPNISPPSRPAPTPPFTPPTPPSVPPVITAPQASLTSFNPADASPALPAATTDASRNITPYIPQPEVSKTSAAFNPPPSRPPVTAPTPTAPMPPRDSGPVSKRSPSSHAAPSIAHAVPSTPQAPLSFFEKTTAAANAVFAKGLTKAEVKELAKSLERKELTKVRRKQYAMLHDNVISGAVNFFLADRPQTVILGRDLANKGRFGFDDIEKIIECGDFIGKRFITFPDLHQGNFCSIVVDIEKGVIEISNSLGENFDLTNIPQEYQQLRLVLAGRFGKVFNVTQKSGAETLVQPDGDLLGFHAVLNSCFAVCEKETPPNIAQIKKIAAFIFGEVVEEFLPAINDLTLLRNAIYEKHHLLDASAKDAVEKRISAAAKVNEAAVQKEPTSANSAVWRARLARESEERIDALLDEIINLGEGSSDGRRLAEGGRDEMFKDIRAMALRAKYLRRLEDGPKSLLPKAAWSAQLGVSGSLGVSSEKANVVFCREAMSDYFVKYIKQKSHADARGLPVVDRKLAVKIAGEFNNDLRDGFYERVHVEAATAKLNSQDRIRQYKSVIDRHLKSITATDSLYDIFKPIFSILKEEKSDYIVFDSVVKYFAASCQRPIVTEFFKDSKFTDLVRDLSVTKLPAKDILPKLKKDESLLAAVESAKPFNEINGDEKLKFLEKIREMLRFGANPFYRRAQYSQEQSDDIFAMAIMSGNQELVSLFFEYTFEARAITSRHRELAALHNINIPITEQNTLIVDGELDERIANEFQELLQDHRDTNNFMADEAPLTEFLRNKEYTPDIQALLLREFLKYNDRINRPDANIIIAQLVAKGALIEMSTLELSEVVDFLNGIDLNPSPIRTRKIIIALDIVKHAIKNNCPVEVFEVIFNQMLEKITDKPSEIGKDDYNGFIKDAIASSNKDALNFLIDLFQKGNPKIDPQINKDHFIQECFLWTVQNKTSFLYEVFLERGLPIIYVDGAGKNINLSSLLEPNQRQEFLSKALIVALSKKIDLPQVRDFSYIADLIDAGADINYRDKNGVTPIEASIIGGCAHCLIDATFKDGRGRICFKDVQTKLDKKIKSSNGLPILHEAVLRCLNERSFAIADLSIFLTHFIENNSSSFLEKNSDNRNVFEVLENARLNGANAERIALIRTEIEQALFADLARRVRDLRSSFPDFKEASVVNVGANRLRLFQASSPPARRALFQFATVPDGTLVDHQQSQEWFEGFDFGLKEIERIHLERQGIVLMAEPIQPIRLCKIDEMMFPVQAAVPAPAPVVQYMSPAAKEYLPNFLRDLIIERRGMKLGILNRSATKQLMEQRDLQIRGLIVCSAYGGKVIEGVSVLSKVQPASADLREKIALIDLIPLDDPYRAKLISFALFAAIQRGKKEDIAEIEGLMKEGADINQVLKDSFFTGEPYYVKSFLELAIRSKNLPMVEFLLRSGAKIVGNAKQKRLSPLMYALQNCEDDSLEIVRVLARSRPESLLEIENKRVIFDRIPNKGDRNLGIKHYIRSETNRLLYGRLAAAQKAGKKGVVEKAPRELEYNEFSVVNRKGKSKLQIRENYTSDGSYNYPLYSIHHNKNITSAKAITIVNAVSGIKKPKKTNGSFEKSFIKLLEKGDLQSFKAKVHNHVKSKSFEDCQFFLDGLLFEVIIARKAKKNEGNRSFDDAAVDLAIFRANPLAIVFDSRNNVNKRSVATIDLLEEGDQLRQRILDKALLATVEVTHDSFGSNAHHKVLLKKGANFNAKDENGNSFLHLAIAAKNVEMIDFILGENKSRLSGGNVSDEQDLRKCFNAENPPKNPLMLAASLTKKEKNLTTGLEHEVDDDENSSRLVRHLLQNEEHHAGLFAVGDDGRNALMVAAQKGYVKTVKVLLEFGVNPELQDEDGRIAKQYAQDVADANAQGKDGRNIALERNCQEVVRILSRQLTRKRQFSREEVLERVPRQENLELEEAMRKKAELEKKIAERSRLLVKGRLYIPRYDFVKIIDDNPHDKKTVDLTTKDGKVIKSIEAPKGTQRSFGYRDDNGPGRWLRDAHHSSGNPRFVNRKVKITSADLRFESVTERDLGDFQGTARVAAQYCKLNGDERLCDFFTARLPSRKDGKASGFFQPFDATFEDIYFCEKANNTDEKPIFGSAQLFGAIFRGCHFENVDFRGISSQIIETMRFENCTGNVLIPSGVSMEKIDLGQEFNMRDGRGQHNLKFETGVSYALERRGILPPGSSPSKPMSRFPFAGIDPSSITGLHN